MLKGSCLCGAVTYEAEALAFPPTHCHCRTCQKAHAAAFATTARVRRENFRWTGGEDVLGAYESTPGKLRRFCTRCGSQLISEWVAQPMVILRIATVEEGDIPAPVAHIWTDHRPAWDAARDDLIEHPQGMPR